MNDYSFYKSNKEVINNATEFVKLYVPEYYLDNNTKLKGANGRAISRTNKIVESYIDDIIRNGVQSKKELIRILAWKMGKISQNKVTDATNFVYHKDWSNAEDNPAQILRYGRPFCVDSFISVVMAKKDAFNMSEPQAVLNELSTAAVTYIGTVYLITLLYFLSKAEYPIYDRFSKIAIDAIKYNIKPGEVVYYEPLPAKKRQTFGNVGEKLEEFKKDIDDIFGYKNYMKPRDIDRALWVYGHMFVSKGKKSGC